MAFQKDKNFEKRDVLQAVIIADEFSNTFSPLTLEMSKLLLNFLNIPLIEYVLESLLASHIEEAYIFCACYGNQVKDYLEKSRWMRKDFRKMDVHVIMSENCLTLGDAMREIENKSVIKNDFVLLTGDIIFNFGLEEIIEMHKKRREEVKDAVMTLIFKEYPLGHPLRVEGSNVTVTLEHPSMRLLSYHKDINHDHFSMQTEEFSKEVIHLRTDLLYREICICAPIVLSLMCDNPDYQTIDHLLKGILVNEKILGNSIFTHILSPLQYAQRVHDVALYKIVSKHVMQRWSYPLVLDESITLKKDDVYHYKRGNLYTHYQLPNETFKTLGSNVVVGKDSKVSQNCHISDSVIGKNCFIASNSILENCYLLDNVHIEECCKLQDSILGNGVYIHKNTKVPQSCIISDNVHLLSTDVVQKGSKLVCKQLGDLEQISTENKKCFIYNEKKSCLQKEWTKAENEWEEDNLDGWNDESDEDAEEEIHEADRFYKEVIKNLRRCLKEDIAIANILLEINSVKHAYGIEILNLVSLLIKALLYMPTDIQNQNTFFANFESQMKKFLPLLKNYVKVTNSQSDFQNELQIEVLSTIEEIAETEADVMKYLHKIIHYLYDKDVTSEESILVWWGDKNTEHNDEVKSKMKAFIKWLQDDEEEDE